MPKISVIIPVYNAQEYLDECIESVLNQTFADFEVILIDDGSTDRSGAICDQYATLDDRVRKYSQTNQGQSSARNHGIREALGEWIHFVDSDDLIHPQMLEILYQAVLDTGASMALCGHVQGETVPEGFRRSICGEFSEIEISETTLLRNFLEKEDENHLQYSVVWGKLIRTDIVKEIPFVEGRIYEDTVASCQWLHACAKVAYSNLPFYFYRMNPQSTVHRAFSVKRLDYLWCWEEQARFYRRVRYFELERVCLRNYIFKGREMYQELTSYDEGVYLIKKRLKRLITSRIFLNWDAIGKRVCLSTLDGLYPKAMSVYWRVLAAQKRIKEVLRR